MLLTWENPPVDEDFVRAKLVRTETSYPSDPADGEVSYEGTLERFTDTDVRSNRTYRYAVFGINQKLIPSEPVAVRVTVGDNTEAEVIRESAPARVAPIYVSPNTTQPSASFSTFTESLYVGKKHREVRALQQLLNRDPDTRIAPFGDGSPGLETDFYGPATQAAVQRFQIKYGIVYGGSPEDTGFGLVGSQTRAQLNVVGNDN